MLNIKIESLAETLDSINDAFFHNSALTLKERTKAAKWITGLQGKP